MSNLVADVARLGLDKTPMKAVIPLLLKLDEGYIGLALSRTIS